MKWIANLFGKKEHQDHNSMEKGEYKTGMQQTWSRRMHSLQKKLSCGSAQIACILKTRHHFGTIGQRDRSHHLPGQTPKKRHQ